MNIKLNYKFVIAFVALLFVMHEAHEIVHTSLGRLICGAWGERDFNVWALAEGCGDNNFISLLPTFAGPLFTFIMIWVGAFQLKQSNTNRQKSLGLALIFANMPFARILTAAFGSGDEVYALSKLLENPNLAWAIGLMGILLILGYPLYKAYVTINEKRLGWFLLFFLAPMAIDLLIVLGLMNTVLEKGILADYWILGSPLIVTLWTIFVVSLFFLTRKHIYTLEK